MKKILELPRHAAVLLIRLYQIAISPLIGPCCRFVPSCSEYGRQAILLHGLIKGGLLTLWRLCRCHPFYHGDSYDPVPPRKKG